MLFVESENILREKVSSIRKNSGKIVLVPTMGNLHEGHLQLIDIARDHGDFVICSIFVNPTQFGENEDFDSYPRTLEADQDALRGRHCDLLFYPTVNTMYPKGISKNDLSIVHVPGISEGLCGGSRPGHFDGVSTVVSKLFNLVLPDAAVFGEKDFQQLAVIRKLTLDLNFPVEIIPAPICRESNGLAMSSRNGYLTIEEKEKAGSLYKLLIETKEQILKGERDYQLLSEKAASDLLHQGFKPDYFEICESSTLKKAKEEDKDLVILLAAFLNKTRLIDNISLSL